MKTSVSEFLQQHVSPIRSDPADTRDLPLDLPQILQSANGFYAFSGALLFRPASQVAEPMGICEWNRDAIWKHAYPLDLTEYIFFAEDTFGYQFGTDGQRVVRMDAETGELEEVARTVEELIDQILADPGELTGDIFLNEWKHSGQDLYAGQRLVAKCPFVCGGEFALTNFAVLDEVSAMTAHGKLATDLVSVPDGGQVVFSIE